MRSVNSVALSHQSEHGRAPLLYRDREIRSAAARYASSKADQDDIAQEMRIRIWLAQEQGHADEAYLWKTAHNAAKNWRRCERRRRCDSVDIDALETLIRDGGRVERCAEEMLHDAHKVAFLRASIDDLPDDERRVLKSIVYDEMTQREAADAMRVSQSRVSQLYRASVERVRSGVDRPTAMRIAA